MNDTVEQRIVLSATLISTGLIVLLVVDSLRTNAQHRAMIGAIANSLTAPEASAAPGAVSPNGRAGAGGAGDPFPWPVQPQTLGDYAADLDRQRAEHQAASAGDEHPPTVA